MNGSNHARRRAWYLLLLAPYIGLLFPGWYSTRSPELFGFPFFYWYQIAWIVLSALLVWIIYLATRESAHE